MALSQSMPPRTDAEGQPRGYLPGAPATIPAPEHHWYVQAADDELNPYCVACGLPRANGRHVKRAV